ncbi:MAG: hypothetical protein ABIH50_03955 [bacterium]
MRRQITSLLVLIAIAYCAAWGELIISRPFIGGQETKAVEVGSSPQVTIKYRNSSANEIAISSVDLNLQYNPAIIDYINSITNNNQGKLVERLSDTSTPGKISYKLESVSFAKEKLPPSFGPPAGTPMETPTGKPALPDSYPSQPIEISPVMPAPPPPRSNFTVKPGKTIDLATINFHLVQTVPKITSSLPLFTISADGCKVIDSLDDVTQGVAALPQVTLKNSAPPKFKGQASVRSGNSFGQKDIGNTLTLNWKTEGAGALEYSRFPNGKLKCKVERSTDPDFAGATELPLIGDPPTSNIENDDYVYQDGPPSSDPLSDGTTYYYRISAADDTSPDANETKDNPPVSGIPYDFTPPGEITGLSATGDDRKITLKWVNPTDADLGGVLIMRNRGNPVAPDSLEGATSAGHGKIYQLGEEPFGPDKGTVIYVSPQEYFSTEYEDNEVENGVDYQYKIFTYDRAIDWEPKEFGRNYSKGVEISAKAGVVPKPISNFIANKTEYPGEVLFTWDNSPDPFCEGIIIKYSTDDKQKFSDLRDENSGKLAGIIPLSSGPGQPDYAYLPIPSGFNYYFKAFAYNYTNEPLDPENKESMAAHAFSGGQTASLLLLVSKEEELFTYTFNFQKGINHFAVPFPSDRITNKDGKVVDISNWENLIDELNAQAGGNVVNSFGRWNEVEQKAEGIIAIDYTKTGPSRYLTTKGVSPTQPVVQGGAFEINISKPFTFILKNIAPQPQY